MSVYVGLDLTTARARIVETEGSGKKLKVTKFVSADVTEPGKPPSSAFVDEAFAERLRAVLKEHDFATDPVGMSWDASLTTFRDLDLPFTGMEQLRKVIKYEAESHLHNCDIEDVVVSFYKLSETPDKSHLMLMAARKDHLLNRIETLQTIGVDPMMVDLDALAMFNTLAALEYTKEHETFAVLDCGRRATNVLVVHKGRMVLTRAIRMGSEHVAARLAHDLADSGGVEKAQALLQNPDSNRDDLLVPARTDRGDLEKAPSELERDLALSRIGDFYGKMQKEVRRTLATSRTDWKLDAIYVTGPGSLMPGFAEEAAKAFLSEAPVKKLDILARVQHEIPAAEAAVAESEMATALGLAFKIAGFDETAVDFRQEEARYAKKFDQVKEPLVYFCSFLLFFVLILNLYDIKKLSVVQPFLVNKQNSHIAQIHTYVSKKFQEAMTAAKWTKPLQEPSAKSIDVMQRTMDQQMKALMGELGRGGTIPRMPSAFDMLRQTFDAIKPKMGSIQKLVITQIKVGVRTQPQRTVEISGYVPAQSGVDDLMEALAAIPEIGPANVERPKTTAQASGIQFQGLKVKFPKPKQAGEY
ncbi:MAG: pilus assembly protein PilM [Planctomycetes bacterium]|nr:pilus assembly protein PilM [Planctomycetota bacterium]